MLVTPRQHRSSALAVYASDQCPDLFCCSGEDSSIIAHMATWRQRRLFHWLRVSELPLGANRRSPVLSSSIPGRHGILGRRHTNGGIMTKTLLEKTCTPCRGGVPALTQQEAETLLAEAPEWALKDEAHRIERTFRFKNFREALSFVQKVGELAEAEGHHPDISFGWGYATVSLRTKKIKGLHENDFIMAAKIDRLAEAGV
jgi:4a-hydroxytetrahydrobiopterin dehydratase